MSRTRKKPGPGSAVPCPPGYIRIDEYWDRCQVCGVEERTSTPPELRHEVRVSLAEREPDPGWACHQRTSARTRRCREGWVPVWDEILTEISWASTRRAVPLDDYTFWDPNLAPPPRGVDFQTEAGFSWMRREDVKEWIPKLTGKKAGETLRLASRFAVEVVLEDSWWVARDTLPDWGPRDFSWDRVRTLQRKGV